MVIDLTRLPVAIPTGWTRGIHIAVICLRKGLPRRLNRIHALREVDAVCCLKSVKAERKQLMEVLTVIDVLELLTTDNHSRHPRHVDLKLRESLLIEVLVLQEVVDVVENLLAIEARQLVYNRLATIRVHVADEKLIRIQILADVDHIVIHLVGLVNHNNLDAKVGKIGHFNWYA